MSDAGGNARIGVTFVYEQTGLERVVKQAQEALQRLAAEARAGALPQTTVAGVTSELATAQRAISAERARAAALPEGEGKRRLQIEREANQAARTIGGYSSTIIRHAQSLTGELSGLGQAFQALQQKVPSIAQDRALLNLPGALDQYRRSRAGERFGLESVGGQFAPRQLELAGRLQDQLDSVRSRAQVLTHLSGESEGARQYQQGRAQEARARQLITAKIQEELARTDELAQAKSREITARNRIAAQTARLQSSQEAIAAEADRRIAQQRQRVAADAEVARLTRPSDTRSAANLEARRAQLAAQQEAQLGDFYRTQQGKDLLQQQGLNAAAQKARTAEIERATNEALAADTQYARNTAAAALARQEQAARIQLAEAGVNTRGLSRSQVIEQAAVSGRVSAEQQQLAAIRARARAIQNGTSQEVQLTAQRKLEESKLNAAIRQQERAYIRDAIRRGELGGTRFQRFQSLINPQARAPEENARIGQYFGGKALQTVGYGLAAGVLYGGLAELGETLREAEELQKVFNQIQAQLQSIGETSSFERVREEIFTISRETGVAADEVGKVFFQFRGAFRDTDAALTSTASAMKLVQVTGLELSEVLDGLTAIARVYGVSIDEIGDITIGLEERFGVLSKETVSFLGDISTVASEAGLGLRDLASIGAVAQQASGRSGTTLSEGLGRILPQIQESESTILSLYDVLRSTAPDEFGDRYTQVLEQLGAGQTGAVFKSLIEDYNNLSKAQQQAIINALGGRREAQVLIPILQNSNRLIGEFQANEQNAERDAGKLNQRFGSLQDTVQNTFARLNEVFKQLGEEIFNSGLAEVFVKAAAGAEALVGVVSGLLNLLSQINEFSTLGGLIPSGAVGTLSQVLLITLALNKALGLLVGLKAKDTAVTAAQAAAETRQALAKAGVTEATALQTFALQNETAIEAINTKSAQSNAAAETLQSGAKSRGAGSGLLNSIPFVGSGNPNSYRAMRNAGATPLQALGPGQGGGLGLAAVVTAGAFAVYDSYTSERDNLQKVEQDYRNQLKGLTEERLQEIADSTNSLLDEISTGFFGVDLPNELAKQEQNRRRAATGNKRLSALSGAGKLDDFIQGLSDEQVARINEIIPDSLIPDQENRLLDALEFIPGGFGQAVDTVRQGVENATEDTLNREQIEALIPELQKKADEGNEKAATAVEELNRFLEGNVELIDVVNNLVANDDLEGAVEAAGGTGQFLALQAETLRSQLATRAIAPADYFEGLRKQLSSQQALRVQKQKAGNWTEEDERELRQFEAQTNRELGERVLNAAESRRRIAEARGDYIDPAAEVARLQTLFSNPNLTDDQRVELIPQIIEALNKQAVAELRKIAVPDDVQALGVSEQLRNAPEFQDLETSLEGAVDDTAAFDGLAKQVGDIVAATGKTVLEATREVLLKRLEQLKGQLALLGLAEIGGSQEDRDRVQGDIDEVQGIIDGLDARLGTLDVDTLDELVGNEEAIAQATAERANADLDVAAALAAGNPVAEAQVEIQRANVAMTAALAIQDDTQRYVAVKQAEAQLISARRQAREAALDINRAEIDYWKAVVSGDAVAEAQLDIRSAYLEIQAAAAVGDRAGVFRGQAQLVQAQKALADSQNDIVRAQLEGAATIAGGDPVAAAQAQKVLADFEVAVSRSKGAAEQIRAQARQIEAQRSIDEALRDVTRAQFELILAVVDQDPVKAAQQQLRLAQFELNNAEGDAARLRALASQIQAQRALADAIADIGRAQVELMQAIAQASGDSVKAAALALKQAQDELKRLQDVGAGQAEILRAQAAVVSAQAGARDAEFEDRMGDIDFLLQIEQITTQQAIEMLQAMANIPNLTEDQLRQIQLKIKQLQGDLNSDLQFNLPTNLDLPTLYESRRVVQSAEIGAGYQDQRQVNVTMYVNTGMDEQQAQEFLSEAIGPAGSGRFGTAPRRY